MFELISGGPRHPFHQPTVAPQIVSVALHVLILTVVLVLPLLWAADKLPATPAMMAFVAPTVTAPPPPPPPAPRVARAAEAKPLAVPTTGQMVAPLEAPAEIAPEPALPGLEAFGVEGGVEGGVIGGVTGGIVGGLVSIAAPPPPPPPPPPAPKTPVRIGGQIQAPALVKRVEPIYPDLAVLAKVTGTVILEAVVTVDGSVESVRVLRSVKFLDNAAIEALKQWRYSPLVLNGEPTPFVLTVTLSFSIKSST
jgi:periplasmic protein TonB